MARSRPAYMAMVRNVVFRYGRQGRPKLMLDTPRMVRTPSSFLQASSACTVASTSFCWALAVRVRQSM